VFPPAAWTEDEILQLIDSGQEEFIELDFKRAESLNNTDSNKKELGKDVSAFANTIGGTIIYGIEEDSNSPHKAIKLSPVDPRAATKEWIEQVINSRIQPRLYGVRIQPINLPKSAPGSVVYVVTIPEGTTAHQASDQRYYKRFNFESVPMHDYEIRQILNRVVRPHYKAWLKAWQYTSIGSNIVIAFRAMVVNSSEITAHDPNAMLYLPMADFALSGEAWEVTPIGECRYRRFVGEVGKLWYPGHPNDITFKGATPHVDSQKPETSAARILLRLFDHFGLALSAEYELMLPSLQLRVVGQTSERRPSQLNP
jgi:Putative DNA-binding domain